MKIIEDVVCIVILLFLPNTLSELLGLDKSMNEIIKRRTNNDV